MMGMAGSVKPIAKNIDEFGGLDKIRGIINKVVTNPDKTPSHVILGDEAQQYYLDAIKHLQNEVLPSGKDAFVNPLAKGNHYSGDWDKPDASIFGVFNGNLPQGGGKLNDILTGTFIKKGLLKPNSLSIHDLANRPTYLQNFF